MGVTGLLGLLKSVQKPCHLRDFKGKTLGVDGYGWLHRGLISCSTQLALGQPTRKYVDFALNRVRMLLHFGVVPYIVLDGDYLPSKAMTETSRTARRENSKKLGLELLRQGRSSEAHQELQKSVDLTPEMARAFIDELKLLKIKYVVAPYEADAQLVYLEKKGLINGILSEDSDLLVFGAGTLLTKLDQYGSAISISRTDFGNVRDVSLVGWADAEFRTMAIMSGCDYIKNIPGLGLKKAHGLIRKYRTIDRIVRAIQLEGKYKVPDNYLANFREAEEAFLYQWVFCPEQQRLVNLCDPPRDGRVDVGKLLHVGSFIESDVACGVAAGELNPHSKKPLRSATKPAGPPPVPSDEFGQKQTPEAPPHSQRLISTFFAGSRSQVGAAAKTAAVSGKPALEQAQSLSRPTSPRPVSGPVACAVRAASTSTNEGRSISRAGSTASLSKACPILKRKRLFMDEPEGVGRSEETSKYFSAAPSRLDSSRPDHSRPSGLKKQNTEGTSGSQSAGESAEPDGLAALGPRDGIPTPPASQSQSLTGTSSAKSSTDWLGLAMEVENANGPISFSSSVRADLESLRCDIASTVGQGKSSRGGTVLPGLEDRITKVRAEGKENDSGPLPAEADSCSRRPSQGEGMRRRSSKVLVPASDDLDYEEDAVSRPSLESSMSSQPFSSAVSSFSMSFSFSQELRSGGHERSAMQGRSGNGCRNSNGSGSGSGSRNRSRRKSAVETLSRGFQGSVSPGPVPSEDLLVVGPSSDEDEDEDGDETVVPEVRLSRASLISAFAYTGDSRGR